MFHHWEAPSAVLDRLFHPNSIHDLHEWFINHMRKQQEELRSQEVLLDDVRRNGT